MEMDNGLITIISSATGDDREGLFYFLNNFGHIATFRCHSVAAELFRECGVGRLIIPSGFKLLLCF